MRTTKLVCLLIGITLCASCSSDPKREPGGGIVSDPKMDTGGNGGDAGSDASDAADGGADTGPDLAVVDMGPDAVDMVDMCVPETDEELCAALGIECGPAMGMDRCGAQREVETCGEEIDVCPQDTTCGGGGEPGVCGCTPRTCEDLGVLCGPAEDSCGQALQCDLFCVDFLTSGHLHSCALGSGKVKCWGGNASSQLGSGMGGDQRNPVDVQDLTSLVDSVAAGSNHTCIVNVAGQVICWGQNTRGQLGVGTTVSAPLPAAPAVLADAKYVGTGEAHSCALVADRVECWGSNDYGQIGNTNFAIGANVAVPTQVEGLEANVTALSVGYNFNCAIQDDPTNNVTGMVKCWGRGRYGQLGNLVANFEGDTFGFDPLVTNLDAQTMSPSVVTVRDPANSANAWSGVQKVAVGREHSCAIDSAGDVYCWGWIPAVGAVCPAYSWGGLDRGVFRCSLWPSAGLKIGHKVLDAFTMMDAMTAYEAVVVAADPTKLDLGTKTAVDVDSGEFHSCFLVSPQDAGKSNVMCFGDNTKGQIGDGTNNPWATPVNVFLDRNNNVVNATQVAAGGQHTCAIVDNNNVECWGSNAAGQIGNSDLQTSESYRPFDVRLEGNP